VECCRLFQSECKIEKGENIIQVRVLLNGKTEMWSGWSGDLVVNGLDEKFRRGARLQRYLEGRHEEEASLRSSSGGSSHALESEGEWMELLLDDRSLPSDHEDVPASREVQHVADNRDQKNAEARHARRSSVSSQPLQPQPSADRSSKPQSGMNSEKPLSVIGSVKALSGIGSVNRASGIGSARENPLLSGIGSVASARISAERANRRSAKEKKLRSVNKILFAVSLADLPV